MLLRGTPITGEEGIRKVPDGTRVILRKDEMKFKGVFIQEGEMRSRSEEVERNLWPGCQSSSGDVCLLTIVSGRPKRNASHSAESLRQVSIR